MIRSASYPQLTDREAGQLHYLDSTELLFSWFVAQIMMSDNSYHPHTYDYYSSSYPLCIWNVIRVLGAWACALWQENDSTYVGDGSWFFEASKMPESFYNLIFHREFRVPLVVIFDGGVILAWRSVRIGKLLPISLGAEAAHAVNSRLPFMSRKSELRWNRRLLRHGRYR